jgi:peptidoglycan/xylan/chitin deacetylase (PgdA/CDA1 family)
VGSELYIKTEKQASTQDAYSKGKNEVLFIQKHPSLRTHSTIQEAFVGKRRIRMLIRLIWASGFELILLPTIIPFPQKRFRVRSLIHFWKGVKDSGVSWEALHQWFGRRVVALGYHDIPLAASKHWLDVSISKFERQMTFLKKQKYQPITLMQYLEWLDNGKEIPAKSLLITFDDGYKSFVTAAAPVLQKFQFPATIFLCPGFLGSTNIWDQECGLPRKDLLSEEEIVSYRSEFQFGAHGYLHKDLTSIPASQLEKEIRLSRQKLTDLGCDPISFSYPYGAFSASIVDAIRKSGFRCALTTEEGTNGIEVNPFVLRRILITRDESLLHFRRKIASGKSFLGFLRKRAESISRGRTGKN